MIAKFKELWSNRRYRALLILGIYLIFFVFVFLVFSTFNKQKASVPLTGIDLFKTKTSYKYTVASENNLEFVISNNKFSYEKNIYDLNKIPEELKKYDLDYFTPNNIYNFIKNGLLESTNFVEKSDTYVVDMDSINTNTIENKNYGKFNIILYKDDNNNVNRVIVDIYSMNYIYMISL